MATRYDKVQRARIMAALKFIGLLVVSLVLAVVAGANAHAQSTAGFVEPPGVAPPGLPWWRCSPTAEGRAPCINFDPAAVRIRFVPTHGAVSVLDMGWMASDGRMTQDINLTFHAFCGPDGQPKAWVVMHPTVAADASKPTPWEPLVEGTVSAIGARAACATVRNYVASFAKN